MEQSGGTPTDTAAAPPARRVKRRWFRFSLQTLVIFVLLVGSGMGLWWKWEAWGKIAKLPCYGAKAVFGPDGHRFVVAGSGEEITVFNAETLKLELSIPVYAEHAEFSDDGERLAAFDGYIRIFDAVNGKETLKIDVPDARGAHLFGDVVAYPSSDGIRAFDAVKGSVIPVSDAVRAFYEREDALWQKVGKWPYGNLSPDAERALLVGDLSLRLLNIATRDGPWHAGLDGTSVRSACFSPDGSRILTTSSDGTSRIWAASDGKLLAAIGTPHFYEYTDPIGGMGGAFFPDGQRIIALWGDGSFVWQKRRPEYWWGVAWLPEFWLTLVFTAAFVWSVWRDRRTL